MKPLIPLANAHVNQHSGGSEKTDWKIEENETNRALGELPKTLNELEVFQVLDFARKYELEAFNIGIQFGRNEADKKYKAYREEMRKENERLANILEDKIISN